MKSATDTRSNALPVLLFTALAVVIHGVSFSEVSSRLTQPYSGRQLFVLGSYTPEFVLQNFVTQALIFAKVHLIPLILLLVAYRWSKVKEKRTPPRATDLVVVSAAMAAILGAGLYQYLAFAQPGAADEFSYLFQSRVFREGRFAMVWEGALDFMCLLFIQSVPWMSSYPPGWSAYLALFPDGWLWLGPVTCTALALYALYLLGVETVGKESAGWGILTVAVSPGFFWQGGTYFPNHSLLAGLALGTALYLRGQRVRNAVLLAISALVFAWSLSNRPVETGMYFIAVGWWYALHRKKLKFDWKSAAVFGAVGAVGALATGVYFQRIEGFYSFVEPEPPYHFLAGVWNAYYPLLRQLEWWCPGFLLLVFLRWRSNALGITERLLLIHAGISYLFFAAFIDNGQVEFGSRYLLCAWAMLCPLAGAELRERLSWLGSKRAASMTVFVLLCYGAAPLPALHKEAASRENWGLMDLQLRYPANAAFFIRSSKGMDPGAFAANLPNPKNQRYYQFLEPGRVRSFRATIKDRPVYLVDWNGARYVVRPFDEVETLDDAFSKMSAAHVLARVLKEREKAIALWGSIPATDPYYAASLLNMAQEYYELRRNVEGDSALQEAARIGVPAERIESVRGTYKKSDK